MQIPRGHVWLQGDNLDNSTDCRDYGPIPYALVSGRVVMKVSLVLFNLPHSPVLNPPSLQLPGVAFDANDAVPAQGRR